MTATDGATPEPSSWQRPTKRELFLLAMKERQDPEPYYSTLAAVTVADLPVPVDGLRILDLGSGPGHDSMALEAAGATVVSVDLDPAALGLAHDRGAKAVRGDAYHLPFPDASFDGVYCSNIVEHVPAAGPLLDEIARVLEPRGWAWISWTNWYSPWGGHHIIPFHLLGPTLGPRVYDRLFGPPPKNVVGEGLFPTYIGETLQLAREHTALDLIDAMPRYYPSQRWILKVPGLREVATWNCLLVLERRSSVGV